MPPKPIKLRCAICGELRNADEFGWVPRKHRPTKSCKRCWGDRTRARAMAGQESVEELALLYAPIREMFQTLMGEQVKSLQAGEPVEHKIASLGDVWVSELTETAYRAIVQALIRKAEQGDVNAAKLLLEERHRRLGEPTAEGNEVALAELFKLAPFATGRDSQ